MNDDSKLTTEFSNKDVEILDLTSRYSGFMTINRIRLRHRLFAGGWSNTIQREFVQKSPGVGVLLYDPELDIVLLVEQFRVGCLNDPIHAQGPWKLELVAGLIDKAELPEEVAIREVKEEADVEIDTLLPIYKYYLSPGSSTETMNLFCAGFDADFAAQKQGNIFGLDAENEDIRTVLMSREEAEKAIAAGIIDNAMSIIALQWLTLNLESVRRQLSGR